MGGIEKIEKKMKELERKGLLQEFLNDYENEKFIDVKIKWNVNYLGNYEVREYVEQTYKIDRKSKRKSQR